MKYLLIILVLLNIADGLLTEQIIKFGAGRETNPFLLGVVGEPTFIILKVAGVLLCVLILWDIHRRHPRLALVSSSCFVAAYAGIVLWNIRVLTG